MSNNSSSIVINNFFWRFLERTGAQGGTFIVSLVLARILDPTVYGTVALVTVFTKIMQVFVDSGLGNALIQKKDADDLDFSSVFYFNICVCAVLYAAIFFCAPAIESFYENEELTPIIRVLGIVVIISGLKNVQQAYVSKNLIFKKFFLATLVGTIGASVIGIVMAVRGYGVWALVAQMLFNTAVDTLVLWFIVPWRPIFRFSLDRLIRLFSYGWKLLASALIDTTYNELRQLIIGKKYSSADLGYYNQAERVPNVIVSNINTSIDSVLLPAMSAEQDDKYTVKAMTRRAITVSTYIMAPMMMGLIAISTPLVRLVLTDKWLPCVPFLYIFCITYMFYPIHPANLNAIKAMGRSDYFLRLEIIKKVIGLVALLISMQINVMAMAISLLFTSVCSQIINSWPNRKLLDYRYIDQLKDILPSVALSVVMMALIFPIRYLGFPDIATVTIQVFLGMVIYFVGSSIFKIESYRYIKSIISKYRNRSQSHE